jgi:general secretion pathway protein D
MARIRQLRGRFSLALAALLAFALAAQRPASAETGPPQPALLTAVAASDMGQGGALVLLTFQPQAQRFQVVGNDTATPGVAFALSSRGPTAAGPREPHGLLRAVTFEQTQTVLVVRFAATGRAHLTVTPTGPTAVSVQITPAAPASVAAAPGPLPQSQDRPPGEDGFEVVFLKYADISEVVGVLTEGQTIKSNDSFVPHEPNFGSAALNGGSYFQPAPNATSDVTTDPLAQSIDDSIAVDRRLNAIILKGSPEKIARMKAKIAEIDVPVESVLLETVFVELDESGAKNVGLDFNNPSGQIGVATFQTGAFIPSGVTGGKNLTSASLQAALYAQVQAGHGRIVSKPRIAAQSGSTAKIITGDALPILTSIALSGVNAVSQQVQYVNVGVTLQIAPRVSDDGFVTSHVFCVVSSVTGTSQGYPTISQREAETSATVKDGDTFVIGGLTEESDIRNNSKIPGLGDIPAVGRLFDLKNDTRAKTELYIVVTPHVVRRGEHVPDPDVSANEPLPGMK